MATEDFKRKLTAVLSADVAGYSRLMAEDEAKTVKTLNAYKQIMSTLIKQHRGRLVDAPGDNVLAEFASVVDAVQCAVSVQKEFQARNADLPENRRMEFRIGINLGDVIEEEDRIYGDGVNIAARLEALADPGGICVSKTAFDQIETKLPLGYEYLGEQEVKNIPKPVGAYRVLMEPRVTVAEEIEKVKAVPVWRRKAIVSGGVVLVLVVIAALVWNFYFRPPPIEPASKDKMAFPLPDKPSVAVLPIVNMSEDPKQEYFCDGLTEEIIAALSMIPDVFVIARNSTFTYKGKSVKVQQVSEELGVRYVLEGSFRKSGGRVRITAQLIDALTGRHVWAGRYEQDLKETFALQDEITLKVVNAMQVKLTEGEQARLLGIKTPPLDLYLKSWQAVGHIQRLTKEDNIRARQLLEEYVELAPESPVGWTLLAEVNLWDIWLGLSKSPKESVAQAAKMAKKAIDLGTPWPGPHMILARVYERQRKHEEAIAEAELAVALAPNSVDAHSVLGGRLAWAGRAEEAILVLKKALRLDPYPRHHNYSMLALAYAKLGRYEERLAAAEKALQLAPQSAWRHVSVACAYSSVGRDKEARAALQEALRLEPRISLKFAAKVAPFKEQQDLEGFLNTLRKLGLK